MPIRHDGEVLAPTKGVHQSASLMDTESQSGNRIANDEIVRTSAAIMLRTLLSAATTGTKPSVAHEELQNRRSHPM